MAGVKGSKHQSIGGAINGKKGGSVGLYATADDLFEAVKAYFAKPSMRNVHFKNDIYQVPAMTFDDLAEGLGFRCGRQAIYDQAKRGEDFAEVVEFARSKIRAHWASSGEHGNASFAQYMLACMGDTPVNKIDHTSSDGSMRPSTIQLVGPDDDSAD